jgi:Fur family transcriptional regulator, ferric uptake regulator
VDPVADVDLAAELRAHGHRATRARLAVWDTLRSTNRHVTADEVVAMAAAVGRPVEPASVYRTLDLLESLGLVRRSRLLGSEATRWEVAHADEHFHLVCVVCGGVDHHVGSLVAVVEGHLEHEHGFEVAEVELRVAGRCAACR